MSTVVFVSDTKPEKGLLQIRKWKAYLSPEQREEILKELKIHGGEKIEDWIVNMHVEIELRKYDTKNT